MESDGSRRLRGVADERFLEQVHHLLADIGEEVRGAPGYTAEDDEALGLFELAVAEIAANVVEHAETRNGVPVHVDFTVRAADGLFEAIFTDDAIFAPPTLDGVHMPDVEAESGRGLALAAAVLDELVHHPVEAGAGNHWELRRRR